MTNTPIESWENDAIAKEIMQDVWFRKLDELPLAMAHGNHEHAQEIIAEAQKILAENIRTKLDEAYKEGQILMLTTHAEAFKEGEKQGREDAVEYIIKNSWRANPFGLGLYNRITLTELYEQARHAGEVSNQK